MGQLELLGFDVGSTAFEVPNSVVDRSTAGLSTSPLYRSLATALERQLTSLRARDPKLGVGMRFGHRQFDSTWLSSEHFRFELAGVVNRLDRRIFAPGTCGELRLLYRLAYRVEVKGQVVTSRVPMTLNVVRFLPEAPDGCRSELERWRFEPSEPKLAQKLVAKGGPLHDVLGRTKLKSVEVNLQSVRWPSTIRPTMAGHAEYLMRVFRREGDALVPAPLENTPDTVRLQNDRGLRERLLAYLSSPDTLRAVDQGTVLLPEEFLATSATSVAPHGLARAANRPMSEVFQVKDVAHLPLTDYTTFRSPEELLRRLDGLSCLGCHQTRSVAGFHFLGDDDASRRADVLFVSHSPHFDDEVTRRRAYFDALLAGQTPDEFRAPSERMGGGGYGAHCSLNPDAGFADWTCDAGLTCNRLTDAQVGVCLPEQGGIGDVCEPGHMKPSFDAHLDAVRLDGQRECGAGHCQRNGVGFPSGMCSGGCQDLPESATCGAVAILDDFNACLARQEPFEQCILNESRPAALRKCSHDAPCREDYICARLPNGEGGCIPPYFLFQMRVDGHVFR